MKKIVVVIIALVLCIPVIALAQQTGGLPALMADLQTLQTNLQNQINNLQNQIKSIPAGAVAIHGSISADGTIIQGAGITVNHSPYSGRYDIYFNSPFTAAPDCIAANNDYLAYSVTVATGKCVAVGTPQPNAFTVECGWLGLACVGTNCDYNVIRSDLLHPLPGDLSFNFICVE